MTAYQYPMHVRLQPVTTWTGGRVTDTDVLELAEAADMASTHAGVPISIKDILRAAKNGEIPLRAIIHRTAKVQSHDGGIYCNAGQENENTAPAGAIPTLPLSACQHLAATGRASWRTFDGFDTRDGVLQRCTKGILAAGEPDFETVPDDCRVLGGDIHALADAFKNVKAMQENAGTGAVVVSGPEAVSRVKWTDEYRADVQAYRDAHGATKTAKHYDVNISLITRETRPKSPKQKAADFTSGLGSRRPKW